MAANSNTSPTTGNRPTTSLQSPDETTTGRLRPVDTATLAETPDGPEPYPDRPEDVTRGNVVSFVTAFEYAVAYNGLHEANTKNISLDAHAVYDAADRGYHYVLAKHDGHAVEENDDVEGDDLVVDVESSPKLYVVNSDLLIRIGDVTGRDRRYSSVFASDDPDENVEQPGDGTWAGFRIYNADTVEHDLSVSIDFVGNGTPRRAFDEEYGLPAGSGAIQESVTYRRGEYRVEARLDGGRRTTGRWTVDESGYGDFETTIFVTPGGGLAIRNPPFEAL